jgi:PAS domain S-box-containing protein
MDSNRLFLSIVGSSLAVVALLLGIAGFSAIHAINEQDRNFRLVTDTYRIKETMEALLEDMRFLRTFQLNYVQDGDHAALVQFDEMGPRIAVTLQGLTDRHHSPDQQARIAEFVELFTDRYEAIRRTMQMRTNGEHEAAIGKINNAPDVGRLSQLNRLASEISDVADAHLYRDIRSTKEANAQARTLVLACLGLSIAMMVLSTIFIFRGFRHRVAAEGALRDSSMRLQDMLRFQHALVDSAAYGIIATNAVGIITEFNRTAEQMLGYKAEDIVDKMPLAQFHDPAELNERIVELSAETSLRMAPFEALSANARQGQIEEREWTYICKNGLRLPVQISMTAIRANGHISGYLGIARDITERRKVERLKSDFVSTVSHELRTPLTSIRGSLGLVLGALGGNLSAQVRGLLQIAHNNADRLGRLINDILDVEKIESGKMDFNAQRQPLTPLLQQAIDGTRDYAREFCVTFELFNKAPDAVVDVDADRFIQVMVNLLSNAVKFSPPTKPVTIGAESHGGTVRITVMDRGKGIPADFQGRIFERFAQADSSDSRQKGGTGLGLAISKSLVEKMNGLIGFDTREGFGTTFYVDLPDQTAVADRDLSWSRTLRRAV